jgi:hypothetical protein
MYTQEYVQWALPSLLLSQDLLRAGVDAPMDITSVSLSNAENA